MTNSYIKKQVIKETRKHLRPLQKCQRAELPHCTPWSHGGVNFPVALKERINRLYPEIEIIWHPVRYTWEVYNVNVRNNFINDMLTHEFTLKAPPGEWLIRHMQEHDNWNRKANDQFIDRLERQESEAESARNKKFESDMDYAWKQMQAAVVNRVGVLI